MKLWLSRPKKGKKKHLVLDMTASEERESSTLIRKHILSRGVRPVRAQKGQRVRYRFNMKYLDRLILAFPMAEHSPGVDALMKKSTAALLEEEVPDLGEIPWFTGELWDFQKIAVKHIVENEDFMLNDEMGLGKTYSAYAALCLLEAFPALVVCPNNAKWVWQRVGEEVTELDIQVVDGTPAQRAEQIQREADVTIINFEGLRAVKMPDPEDKRRKVVIPKSNPALFDYEYAMLITDEYHRVKNPGAQQTVGYLELEAERQLHMSGTPILNRPDEIWPTLHRIDPARFDSFYMFEKAIVMRDGGKIVGYEPRAMSDLRNYIAEKSLRRRKDQVINDLPHVVYSTRPVELTTEQRRLYNQIRDNFIIETEDQQQKRVHYRSQIMREKQACFSPELYGGSTTSAKIDELKVVVKELVDNGEKAIIFSQWAKATRIIERELADYNPAYVDGSVKGSKRMAQVDKFNEDENCYLYIGTIRANKESITLDAATYVIFTDKDWNPKNNEQAAARSAAGGLRGMGVEGTVNIIELIARDTIEEKIEEMLAHKIAVFNSLIEADGGAEPVRITLEDYRNLFEESA